MLSPEALRGVIEAFITREGTDYGVQDVSLVFAKREPRERIGLVTPQHGVAHADNVPPGMTWNSTPAYDRVQITQPEPGTWQIERPAGNERVILIDQIEDRTDYQRDPQCAPRHAPRGVTLLGVYVTSPVTGIELASRLPVGGRR
jgi:hypothetical protein